MASAMPADMLEVETITYPQETFTYPQGTFRYPQVSAGIRRVSAGYPLVSAGDQFYMRIPADTSGYFGQILTYPEPSCLVYISVCRFFWLPVILFSQ